MTSPKETLFTALPSDHSPFFSPPPPNQHTLFSSTSIPALTKQFALLPIDTKHSTLFGAPDSPHDVPSSPASSILSIPDESTQDTLPDFLWPPPEDPHTTQVRTWETFGAGRDAAVEGTPFLTEVWPGVFDELLQRHMNHIYSPHESGIVVDEVLFREVATLFDSVLRKCLLSVSVGYESSLFKWNEKAARFESAFPNVRVVAISPGAAQSSEPLGVYLIGSVSTEMCRRGTMFRRLSGVTEKILLSPAKYGSIAVSFARSVLLVTQDWQARVQRSYAPRTEGVLALQSQFSHIDDSLRELGKLCHCNSRSQKRVVVPQGADLLSQLYALALKYDFPTPSPLRALSVTLLRHSSAVFLDLLTYWTGFPARARGFSDVKEWFNMDSSREFFIQRIKTESIAHVKTMREFDSLFQVDDKLIPGFVERDVALMIFEMGSGLRLLWRVKPDHPLCDVFDSRMASEGLELRWLLSWGDIHDSHHHLDSYAQKLDSLIANPRTTTTQPPSHPRPDDPTEFGLFETKEEAEQMISHQIQQMSLLPQQSTPTPFLTDFHTLHNTFPSTSPPPLSLALQNSLHHALQTQSTLIQKSLVTLFLTHLKLPTHLSTLHRFLLFGDGCFVTRLHEALFEDFDADDRRAGGQTGLGLGIGLLVGKDVWPPSGGKTSVVLRNVLAQSGVDAGEVSFGYREMSDDQFEKVKNPIGLEALDFLQLQYKPGFPLDAVITSPILERYDRLFLFLVRVFRMQYVAAQLFRDSSSKGSYTQAINPLAQRFRIEAHHFITAIASYIFNVSISTTWHSFLARLPQASTLSEIRDLHARCVDTMCVTSFLKKRQSPILTLLYGTFETILLFAKQSRIYAQREQRVWTRMREEMEDNTRILYGMFVKRAGMFVRVIGELERRGIGRADGEGIEGGWFEDLLVRLDGSYFDRV